MHGQEVGRTGGWGGRDGGCCCASVPDSGGLRLDLARFEQGPQCLQVFPRGSARPDQRQKPLQHHFQEVPGLTLAIEKRSRARSAAWRSSSRVQARAASTALMWNGGVRRCGPGRRPAPGRPAGSGGCLEGHVAGMAHAGTPALAADGGPQIGAPRTPVTEDAHGHVRRHSGAGPAGPRGPAFRDRVGHRSGCARPRGWPGRGWPRSRPGPPAPPP